MSLLSIVFRQMRQRTLGTTLTIIMITIAVALAMSVLLIRREAQNLMTQSDFGFDVVVGAKGSQTQLVLGTVLLPGERPLGLIPYSFYEQMTSSLNRRIVRWAVPIAVPDRYEGYRVIATTPRMFHADAEGKPLPEEFSKFEYRKGRSFQFAEGRCFHERKFEAVLGATVAKRQNLKLGDKIQVTHEGDVHAHDEAWEIVGVLKPTGVPMHDETVYMSLISSYAVPDHTNMQRKLGLMNMPKLAPLDPDAVPTTQNVTPLFPDKAPKKEEHKGHDDGGHDHHKRTEIKGKESKEGQPHEHKGDGQEHDEHKLSHDGLNHDGLNHGDHDHGHQRDHNHGDAHHDHAEPKTDPKAKSDPKTKQDDGHKHDTHDHGAHDDHNHGGHGGDHKHDEHKHDDHDHAGHDHAHAYELDEHGLINLKLSKSDWFVSAIYIRTRGEPAPTGGPALQFQINAGNEAMAALPAQVMQGLFDEFLEPASNLLLAIALLVLVVAAAAVTVSIYNSIAARTEQIAVFRALGATRKRIVTIICTEALLIGLIGAVLGLILGHVAVLIIAPFIGPAAAGISVFSLGGDQALYLLIVLGLSLVAGLIPALKAYSVSVAENLS